MIAKVLFGAGAAVFVLDLLIGMTILAAMAMHVIPMGPPPGLLFGVMALAAWLLAIAAAVHLFTMIRNR